ncbi:hypothetical protein OIU79_012219 [Salix purpurea]|uniref:Uncharacterized protein n=1 Tax=Salix purpurea TaxID=77065 RepID=A0A9Q0Q2N1_SALPP|nr:hypothetical protein OIU79_012219 [Salix purpurea]KAJ6698893.1 hypothetical protein OIU79_012219 [Salix purpurea]
MPGAIEVSVLDFMGLQSSSPPSQMSIKVSMGKREYETRDKGDFIFPLATLRENLIVTLMDAKGNEISHTGVETRLVIEKGIWDDTFPLEGGGHVRMKLQFVLSEEDRHRIRLMRELALKKKHDELLSREPRCTEYASAVDSRDASSSRTKHEVSAPPSQDSRKGVFQSEVMATQVSLIVTLPTFSKSGKSSLENGEGSNCVLKQTSPNDPDKHEGSSSIVPVSQRFGANLKEGSHKILGKKRGMEPPPIEVTPKTIRSKEALYYGSSEPKVTASNKIPVKLKGHGDSALEKQNPVNNTPSNVKNMITAFESSLNQDMKPEVTPLPVKSASSRLEMEFPPKTFWSDEVRTEKNKPEQSLSGRDRSPYLIEDMQGASKNIREGEENIDFGRAPTVATPFQDTGKLEEELSDASCRNKGSNVVLKNKLQIMDKADKGKEKTSDILMRDLVVDKASVPGRMRHEDMGKHPYSIFLARKKHSGDNLLITKSGKETHSKDLERINIQEGSGDAHSSECCGAWIFPYERRRLCITTAGTRLLNLMGSFWDDTKVQPGKMSSSVPENMEEVFIFFNG